MTAAPALMVGRGGLRVRGPRRLQRGTPLAAAAAAIAVVLGVFPDALHASVAGPGPQGAVQPHVQASVTHEGDVPPLNLGQTGAGDTGSGVGTGRPSAVAFGGRPGGAGAGSNPGFGAGAGGGAGLGAGPGSGPGPGTVASQPSPTPGQGRPTPTPSPSPTPTPPPPPCSSCQGGSGSPQIPFCYSNSLGPDSQTTEDPLSPPCVPAWDPNSGNGGGTSPGVSADHVDVVVLGSYGNFAYIDPSWDDYINGRTNTCPTSPCDNSALDLRVLRAFFQTHFQTYGRTVVLHGFTSSQSLTGASLANAIQSYASSKGFTPFAIVGGGRTGRAAPAFADAGIEYLDVSPPAFPLFYWASALDHRPVSGPCAGHHCYWSFQPTLDEVLDNGASWICHSLAGAPPTGTADPTIRLSPARKIVLGYTKPDDENFLGGSLSVIREVADRTDRECGCPAGPKCRNKGHVVDMDNSPFLLQQTFGQAAGDPVGNLMVAGDTSVVCVLCEQFGLDYWAVDESNANYYPEMLVLSGDTADNYNGRYLNQAYFNGGIAIAPFWQLAGYTHTYWYRAYHSVDPTTTVGLLTGITDYQEFMQLFSAIQLAGSTLTPGRVEAGFMTWQRSFRPGDTAGLRSASPAAGYTSDVPSFLHGMVEERWDSSCVPPEGPYPNTLYESGGYRILDYQDRFSTIADLAHDLTRWFDQDDSAESPVQAPCTGDDIGVEGSGVP